MSTTHVVIAAEDLPLALRPAFDLRDLDTMAPEAILSDEHSAASYGLPVLVYHGTALGPGDLIGIGTEPAPVRTFPDSDPDLLQRARLAGFHIVDYRAQP